jgi:hypothetical protein
VLNIAGSGRLAQALDVDCFRRQTAAEVEAVQLQLRAFLRALAGATPITLEPFTPTLHVFREGAKVRVAVSGNPRDVTLYLAAAIAQEAGIDKLLRCGKAECGKVFVKIGRREFCSSECQRTKYLSTYDSSAARARRTRKKGARHGKTKRTRRG